MIEKKKEKFPYHLLILSVILLIFVIGLVWMLYRIKESPAEDVSEAAPEVKQTEIMDLTKGYDVSNIPFIGETVYDGTTQLPKEVFQIPFYYPFSDMVYKSNKAVVKELTSKEIQTIMDTSTSFVKSVLSLNSLDVGRNWEGFKNNLESCMEDCNIITNVVPSDECFAELLGEWCIEQHVSMDARVETDKSMISQNGHIICRTVGYLVVNQIEDASEMENYMNENIILGKEYLIVVDVILSGGDYTKIAGFRSYSEPMIEEIYNKILNSNS